MWERGKLHPKKDLPDFKKLAGLKDLKIKF